MKSLIGTITVVGAVVFGVPIVLAWADCMGAPGCGNDGFGPSMLPGNCFNGTCIPNYGIPDYGTRVYDDTPVGKAMALCARHEVPNGIAYPEGGHPPYPHANGWEEACAKLARMWEGSETAKRQREAVEQEKRDLEFVNGVAAGAKK